MVLIPARFSAAQEREWVSRMVARLDAQERRRRPSDVDLERRARELRERYLGDQARIGSVRWSASQGKRWGSCTVATGDIRISTRLRGMPSWVLDYVLIHELAHTIVAGHTTEFWALVEAYPKAERARGFLEGISFAHDGAPHDDPASDSDNEIDSDVEMERGVAVEAGLGLKTAEA